MTHGEHPRLPGEFFEKSQDIPTADLIKDLKQHFAELRTPPFRQSQAPTQLPDSLMEATHVFVQVDRVKLPLVPPYEGPYEVVAKHPKYFVIYRKGREDKVSIDQLKPARLLP